MEQPSNPIPAVTGQLASPEDPPTSAAGRVIALVRALGPARLLALGATAIALLGLFAYLVLRVVEPSYTLLYGGLDLEDSAEIVGRLEAMGVPFRLHADGESVLVPADQALRLRMTLAEEGLPRGGTVGDEIFDQSSALGTTNFLANVNLRRALEGELARTIAALADVKSARVHLVLPKRELFRREQIEPSASITLRMLGGRRLQRRQVLAIQHLVAAAVPGLTPDRIAIIDDQGTLLARGSDGDASDVLPAHAEEHRLAYQNRLKQTIEHLLERSLGPGRVHAEVTAELDFDQVTETEETFDPLGQVIRSTQTVEEETALAERDQNDAVTVGNNLPNAGAETAADGRTSNENTTRTEETINYEVSRKLRNHTQVGGRVRRLSVAVMVDGRTSTDGAGESLYTPLTTDELAQFTSLVQSAIGFDAARGDVVEVTNMAFSAPEIAEQPEESWLALTKHDLLRLAELAALVMVALVLILMVLRPTLTRLLPAPAPAFAGAGAGAGAAALAGADPVGLPRQVAGSEGAPALPGMQQPQQALAAPGQVTIQGTTTVVPGTTVIGTDGRPVIVPADPAISGGAGAGGQATAAANVAPADFPEEIIEGGVRLELLNKAREAADRTPEEAIAIIRAWLHGG